MESKNIKFSENFLLKHSSLLKKLHIRNLYKEFTI